MSSLIAAAARGDWFDEYTLVETFTLPDGADVFDVLPDGRIILLVDAAVHVETRMRSREFVLRGTLQGVAEMPYPAFVRVSPGGERFAVGDNSAPGSVGVFN
ncbi:MAG: hypothetical protein ACE5HE_14445, partial [Phycisphaerae bacterium]